MAKKSSKKSSPKTKSKSEAAAKPRVSMVAIGASAGGLEPFERFFDAMPVTSGIAFVVIQHLSPDFESMMDELLSRHSSMDIKRVVDDLEVEPNTIYLNPPRSEMVVKDGRFKLNPPRRALQINLPIDTFFESLAEEYGDKALAIVLSGTGRDGTRGAALVKEAHGVVIAQSPSSAKFDGMPRSVIESGNYDAIAAPHEIPILIKRIHEGKSVTLAEDTDIGDDPAQFSFNKLRDKFGTDFGYYKEATLRRRFERRAQLSGTTLETYARRLEQDEDELDALYGDLLIDVTSFFRDPKGFEALHKDVIASLGPKMTHDRQIRVWVAGCAGGEEAYSIAIAFAEFARENNLPLNLKILATDVHQRSLGAAAEGIYPKTKLTGLSDAQVARYFEKHVDYYQVNQQLRRLVVFSRHNLLRDPPFTRIDLVTCRNVMIYFLEEAQQKTLALFHFALTVHGFLFLGPSESLGRLEDEFEQLNRRWKIFKKLRDVRLLEATSLLPRDSTNRPPAEIKPPFLAGRTGSLQRFQKAHTEALELMLKRFAPAGFLLNRNGEIVHVFGDAGKYVKIDGGIFSNRIIDLIAPELRLAITAGLERVITTDTAEYERRVMLAEDEGQRRSIIVTLTGLPEARGLTNHYLLTLDASEYNEITREILPKFLDTSETSHILQARIQDLERDLTTTEESLQSMVEELQTSNEELQATNEEMMASNEELQSTNEELHSVNEELYTVSAEHQQKIDELTVLSADMNHLLKATNIGIIFLDSSLKIRRFTPSATAAFNLLDQDIGRPFKHTTYRFSYIDIHKIIDDVIETGKPVEYEVAVEASEYVLNVLPYHTLVRDASGIVITLFDVTEMKRTERNRLAEQKVFKTTVSDLSEAVTRVRLEDGILEMCNQVFADSYSQKAEYLIGKKLDDIVGKEQSAAAFEFVKTQKPGDRHQHEIILDPGTDKERVMRRNVRSIGNDKGEIIALQTTEQDITNHFRYTKALEALVQMGENAVDNVQASLSEIMRIGSQYFNMPFGMVSKITPEKNLIKNHYGYRNDQNILNIQEIICGLLPGDFSVVSNANTTKKPLKKSGVSSYVATRIRVNNKPYGALSFTRKTTRDRLFTNLDNAMIQLLARGAGEVIERHIQLTNLEARQIELENVNEGLNRFTYLASHDLQEPLRKIQQSGELLEMDSLEVLDEEGQYFLKIMTKSAARMRALIDDLLLYSSTANQSLEKHPVSLSMLLDEVREELSEKLEANSADLLYSDLPKIACDGSIFKQVLLNIIGNSLKYRQTKIPPKITIHMAENDQTTEIHFIDNGIGMNIDNKVNIFEPFVRMHSREEYSGSGIGLAICKSICESHGWTIEIESKLEEGTDVFITLPNSDVITE